MTRLADAQPSDPRGGAIEGNVAKAFRANAGLENAKALTVSCTITMCRLTGNAPVGPSDVREALRDAHLLEAFGSLGYSAGPDVETPREDGTEFMFFLNREM